MHMRRRFLIYVKQKFIPLDTEDGNQVSRLLYFDLNDIA